MERAKGFLKKATELIKKPEMRILPGHLAFFFVMSLIPIIALLGAIATKLSISVDVIQSALNVSVAFLFSLISLIEKGKQRNDEASEGNQQS